MSKKIDEIWENLTEEEREELFNKYSEYFYKTEPKRKLGLPKEKVGYSNDTLFLLSTEEYEKHKNRIPQINCCWWLRSSGCSPNFATFVYNGGTVGYRGNRVTDSSCTARPAIKISDGREHNIGERVVFYAFPWIVIGKDLAIAEMPIAFRRFDENSNDYADSEIRKFLSAWMDNRSELREGE